MTTLVMKQRCRGTPLGTTTLTEARHNNKDDSNDVVCCVEIARISNTMQTQDKDSRHFLLPLLMLLDLRPQPLKLYIVRDEWMPLLSVAERQNDVQMPKWAAAAGSAFHPFLHFWG